MITLLSLLYVILVALLSFYSLFWLVSTLIGLSYKAPQSSQNPHSPETLLLLPAYKPSPIFHNVLDSVAKAIKNRNIKVLVLLQEAEAGFETTALSHGFMVDDKAFSHLPGNSYHHALQYLTAWIDKHTAQWKPEFVMLLDKDNIIDEQFFNKIDTHLYEQYDVLQGRRVSLNTDQSTSFFDTVSEGLNDLMFRAAGCRAGNTLEISGSAALIRTHLFREAINNLNPKAPGFDKNFMVNILTNEVKTEMVYLPYSIVREEKTTSIEAHNPQRLRWFGEQYFNAIFSSKALISTWLKKGRWSALWYLMVLYRPPRSVQILILPLLLLAEIGLALYMGNLSNTFIPIFLSTLFVGLSGWLTLGQLKLQSEALHFVVHLPALAINNIANAFKSVKSENRGKFIHTDHKL